MNDMMPPEMAEKPKTKSSYDGVKFPLPEGFVAPEGVSEGGTFEALATLELEDGKLCLKAIDGLAVESTKDKAAETDSSAEEEANPEDFKVAIMSGLKGAA
jgi:hypothetical protein